MSRTLKIALLLMAALFFCPHSARAQAPAATSCNSGNSFNSTNMFCFWTGNFTHVVNDLLVVAAKINSTTATWANGSDSCPNTWTQVPGSPWIDTTDGTEIIAMQTIVSHPASCNAIMTFSTTVTGTGAGVEIGGTLTNIATVFDCASTVSAGSGQGNGTSMSSANCTTQLGAKNATMTNNNSGAWEMIILAYKLAGSTSDVLIGFGSTKTNVSTYTAGAGYTMENQTSSSFNGSSAIEDANAFGPFIGPTSPVVKQGSTVTFSCTAQCGAGGTFSVTGTDANGNPVGPAGSINAGSGVYTPPATITNQQTVGGTQLMPNNHIYNTRIDSLLVCTALTCGNSSATLIAGAGTVPLSYLPTFPLNYTNNSTPTMPMVFFYTPNHNGNFQITPYPAIKLESGWFNSQIGPGVGADHHFLGLNTDTHVATDIYQIYPAGAAIPSEGCALCTSQSGLTYSIDDYTLPGPNNGTDAAALNLWPLTLRLQELEQAVAGGCPGVDSACIKHAVRMTLQNGYIGSCNVWPASIEGSGGGGINCYGERIRLKAVYNISGFSVIAQVILTQLKEYGIELADGGTGWQIITEQTRFPKTYAQAFHDIDIAGIGPSNFDVVDQSPLEVSSTSGVTTSNREIVCFTRTADGITACTDVILQGVAVTFQNDRVEMWPGAQQINLYPFVNIGAVTCTMSPSVGSLTNDCKYTPPVTNTIPTSTVITATSTTNAAVGAQMTVVVHAVNNLVDRVVPGQPSNYVDTGGKTWFSGELGGGSAAANFATLSSYGYNNGGSWPATPDITLYKLSIYNYGDLRYDVYLPNGTYNINAKLANNSPVDLGTIKLEQQGTASAEIDIFNLVGANQPYDGNLTATVTNGLLSFVVRDVANVVSVPNIGALSITQASSAPPPPSPAAPPKRGLLIGKKRKKTASLNRMSTFAESP